VRKGAKKVRKGLKTAGKFIKKNEPLRRGVMAARRGFDYGIKFVPIAGNVYSLADFGVKAARAKRQGKLKQFMAKEAVKGIASSVAPEAYAAMEAKDASKGVMSAIVKGKGCGKKCCATKPKPNTMVVRRRRRNM